MSTAAQYERVVDEGLVQTYEGRVEGLLARLGEACAADRDLRKLLSEPGPGDVYSAEQLAALDRVGSEAFELWADELAATLPSPGGTAA